MELNLKATTPEQERVKEYLQQNVSDVLAEKINNGVKTERKGAMLINKKDLDGFMKYAYEQARKLTKGNCACVSDETVFGWAVHYFEEDSIVGTLYNEDGTVHSAPAPTPKPEPESKPSAPKAEKTKEEKPKKDKKVLAENQFSLFDMCG